MARRSAGLGWWLRLLLVLGLLVAVVVAAFSALVWQWLGAPLALKQPQVELSVEAGASPRDVAQGWVDAGVLTDARWLYQWFRWSGESKRIRAGSYEVEAGVTPRSLLHKMVQGRETLETVRFIEGWTVRQMREELARAPYLKQQTAGLSSVELMNTLGAPGVPAEGRFFPDTYAYSRGASDLAVLKRAHQAMNRQLNQAWADRAPGLPLQSVDEALTLASLVEKETGRASDRAQIAGVFINRLRLGMLLQTDPSVIYGLGPTFDGNLRKRDLLTDSPFNTYTRGGLPPTPIALPGLASLRAAVQPQATKALYFVARGDGSSAFSDNLADHNRAVNKFQRGGSR